MLFLCGDVMTGRGIDQILPVPCDPVLDEPWVKDARDYVRLAERASGPIPRRVEPGYVWGDALTELEREQPDARIINFETAVTTSEERAHKGINYHRHLLTVAPAPTGRGAISPALDLNQDAVSPGASTGVQQEAHHGPTTTTTGHDDGGLRRGAFP